ncbi:MULTISPECIES: ketoacyl-ACP synthase III family protein [Streptomyces]|uniref:ketoacyl-ACP synthase III family protein n=1 Tax=Streptomyces TaxID=1883 RepID=UPI000978F280|nr:MULTISPECIES: ketoacyl-ACP synthase III family protein [unclassified Streptomyces]ONI52536.1 3-oxoacyl-[acyl-carrier-protein] synthase 3 [Streptomyces sp. IB2014 011-1]RDV51354.1 3-oxoacyl-ACP synthase [Streptomyces sp. IB2014 011-12]
MKTEALFIAGTATYLPPATKVEQAVADGRFDAQDAEDTQLESVCEATDEAPPEMAVAAARDALERSGHRAEDIALLLHACVYFQGLELYPTASYIHREVLGDHSALAFEVKNASNGCMTALDIAARSLAATDDEAALVTTADKVSRPAIDRWNSDIGIVPGDGASAMVLSKRSGFAQVLSTSTVSDPTLERLHRGDAPFTPHHDPTLPIDLRLRKLQYLGDVELDEFTRRFRAGLGDCVDRALRDADIGLGDVARFVVPHFGRTVLQREVLAALDIDLDRTTWSWGRTVGHLGAGDQIAGLDHLVRERAVDVGDLCMLLGVGAGFTWTCAVVRITELPQWPTAPAGSGLGGGRL